MITAYGHYGQINKRAHSVRGIALEEVLKRTDSNRHPWDKAKWYTSQGVVSISGEKFFNWTAGVGGGGAIDLVIHLMEYDFKAAVNWLWKNFSPSGAAGAGESNHQNVDMDMGDLKTLKLPQRDESKLPRLLQYLTHQRCLPEATVNYLIRRGILYADDKGNAVFLLLGKGKRVVGAEIRGTDDHPKKWHGMASGSRKDMGFFT